MATIDDVIEWAKTLPPWQGDAVRRLLEVGEQPLSEKDYSEILTLARADLKISKLSDSLKPKYPTAGAFSGSKIKTDIVKLLSIENVQNVNLIRSDQRLVFNENGITVIYGDNGAGKSGYSRILKLACRARDREERILPDVFTKGNTDIPKATIKIKLNGNEQEVIWQQDSTEDSNLSNIAVFDSRCARIITDDRNEITYLPYGGDIFEKLASLVLRIKEDIETEIIDQEIIKDSSISANTPSAAFLESLSESTKLEEIDAAACWSDTDESRLLSQEELLRFADTTKATKELSRINGIKERLSQVLLNISKTHAASKDLGNEAISKALAETNAAKLAHDTAMRERSVSDPLAGVASTNHWAILYNAAKQYSEEIAYPGEPFPKTSDALCVLCQQPLTEDAIARFKRFKKFIEDKTNTILKGKRKALEQFREKYMLIEPQSGSSLDYIYDQLTSIDARAAEVFRNYSIMLMKRKTDALAIIKEGEDPENVKNLIPWPDPPEDMLKSVIQALSKRVDEISSTKDPDVYQKLQTIVTQLRSRKALCARKGDIISFVEKACKNAILSEAIDSLRTKEIRHHGTNVIRNNLTPELIKAFRKELNLLGARHVPISVKPSGAAGETTHEMLLEGANIPKKIPMSRVLSEGEARVIAVAGFLAELELDPHTNAIVFDDPVSSLDHVYAGKIASRLALEGLKRQVIIFTHNIGFLMELDDACEALAKKGTPVGLDINTLHRQSKSAGITTAGLPWYGLKVKQRVEFLEQRVHEIKSLHGDKMTEYNERAAIIYGRLREAWEACIEDDLFHSVVCRYRNSVQTLKLIKVNIEDPDVHNIDLNMSKASTWMTGHDKSKALHHDRPSPDELLQDIDALRQFSKKIIARREDTEKRRKKMLMPS